jgi:preprotein translocase subunit YajC
MIRPMRRQEQQRQSLVANLKKNDKVVTHSGIIGWVVAVAEKEDEVTIKVDDNVRLKMLKSAIARNVTQEEALKGTGQSADASK